MSQYVVVTREGRHPIQRFYTMQSAGNYIFRERAFDKWTVLAQDGTITPSTPYRQLNAHEKRLLERALFPSLWE